MADHGMGCGWNGAGAWLAPFKALRSKWRYAPKEKRAEARCFPGAEKAQLSVVS
jgi:hypothetical protein